jgi:hypothetical protein
VRRVVVTFLAVVASTLGALALADCAGSSGGSMGTASDGGADGTTFDAYVDAPLDVDPATRAAALAACATESAAYCARAGACFPTFLAETFGDVTTCEARLTLSCVPTVLSVGSQTTAADVQACAAALPTADCDAVFVDNAPPAACETIAGTLSAGSKCAFGEQCKGALCNVGPSGCGSCVGRNEAGVDCSSTDECTYGTVCASGTCVAPMGEAGSPCVLSTPCTAPNRCAGGTLTCTPPLEAGAFCNPNLDNACDSTQSVQCIPAPDPPLGGVCAPPTLVASGACGEVGSVFVACTGGGVCANVDGNGQGTCMAPAADGAPCDGNDGPLCLPPAICVSGTCVVDDENSCR